MGYGGIINHGVYAYNLIAHELVRRLGQSSPASLAEMSARFAGPVKPGDKVIVDVWSVGPESGGHRELRWNARVEGTGKACLTEGRAVMRIPAVGSKM